MNDDIIKLALRRDVPKQARPVVLRRPEVLSLVHEAVSDISLLAESVEGDKPRQMLHAVQQIRDKSARASELLEALIDNEEESEP